MQNDETQEDVTLENNVEQEEEETEEVEDETTEESEPDWKAEAKKWEAIAKRKAKKAESAAPANTPASIDADLADTVYRNHLSSHGLTTQDAQDKAFEMAKKTGQSISQLTADPDILAVLQAKEKAAKTKQAIAPGTGGSTVQKSDAGRLASGINQGRAVKDSDVTGSQALELLGLKR